MSNNNRTAEYLGKGIGTVGIWVGIGLVGVFDRSGVVGLLGLFALIATIVVWNR